ncbi:hypothetical protein [Gluconacetobacter entanii]|uniref:hypothetical protein n=1 Tax=Gluconacetobacter entanii TaxID=108528 RepID=UPI0011B727E7|nr:hypothetical protein [Gluconacetobacter entanii]MBE7621010.1 hypothetical protein [Komagataeibacter sp. FXV2]MCE2578790.1 hypothetical protein [Komagataeibacter sp. FNDCR1]
MTAGNVAHPAHLRGRRGRMLARHTVQRMTICNTTRNVSATAMEITPCMICSFILYQAPRICGGAHGGVGAAI